MNNHFNLNRFGLLFRKHTVEYYRTYLLSLGVLLGGMFLIMGTASYLASRPLNVDEQSIFFFFFLLGAGAVYTSTVFAQLGDKNKAIAFLTLPASQMEKYLVGWLYSFPIYLLLFVPSFYLIISILLHIDSRVDVEPELLNIFTSDIPIHLIVIFYSMLNAVMLFGSILFKKNQFVKTAFIIFIGIFLLYNLNKQAVQLILGRDLISSVPFSSVVFKEGEQYFDFGAYEGITDLIMLLPLALGLLVWVAAFFKIKEKQV